MKHVVRVAGIAVVMSLVGTASADLVASYSWEDQDASVLDSFGNIQIDGVVSGATDYWEGAAIAAPGAPTGTVPGASDGTYYLHVSEQQHNSTPNAIIAAVFGLSAGDSITATLEGWDDTLGASPSPRLWFCEVDENGVFSGSATGIDAEYTPGNPGVWDTTTATIASLDAGDAAAAGIGIQLRIYSTPSTDATLFTDYLVDNLNISVTTANSGATILLSNGTVIPEPTTFALLGVGGLLVALRRRR